MAVPAMRSPIVGVAEEAAVASSGKGLATDGTTSVVDETDTV